MERVHNAMREESAGSRIEEVFLRRPELGNDECLGMASLKDEDSVRPELGLWLKESAQRQGLGREMVTALVEWGHASLGKGSFIYPVALQNIASRRIAENLGAEILISLCSF